MDFNGNWFVWKRDYKNETKPTEYDTNETIQKQNGKVNCEKESNNVKLMLKNQNNVSEE